MCVSHVFNLCNFACVRVRVVCARVRVCMYVCLGAFMRARWQFMHVLYVIYIYIYMYIYIYKYKYIYIYIYIYIYARCWVAMLMRV